MADSDELKHRASWRLDAAQAQMLNLTQRDSAERYGISYGQVLDIIGQRSLPLLATRTLIEAVRLDPELIERAASSARRFYGPPIN